MATSTNYGWSEPDNTSLVKNGAQAMRTLGDAIDVSLWNSGYGQAGKNKIINGDFSVNQRAFTSNTTNDSFNFDRWLQSNSGGSFTVTPQNFTLGAAPVAGYEATTFLQGITASQSAAGDYASFVQRIENVRTFAGNTVTISFWAKANTGTPKIGVELQQVFGSGGSPSATVSIPAGAVTLTTSFARYSVTVAVPSISGKTIGTTAGTSYLELDLWTSAGSTYATRASSIGIQNFTAAIWGVQVEYGSKATPFQIASGGSPQAELAMCQRYYERVTDPSSFFGPGFVNSATLVYGVYTMQTTKRAFPTFASSSATAFTVYTAVTGTVTATANAAVVLTSTKVIILQATTSGQVGGQGGMLGLAASSWFELSSEI